MPQLTVEQHTAPPVVDGLTAGEMQAVWDSPLLWAETFLHNPKDGLPFEANYLQKIILETPYRRNVIRVHRRAGKCALDTDRLYLADGTVTTYGAMVGKTFEVLTLVAGVPTPVAAYAYPNAHETVYEIEMASGVKVVRNAEHPFYRRRLSGSGWAHTSELLVGDALAAPTSLPFETPGVPGADIQELARTTCEAVPDAAFRLTYAQNLSYLYELGLTLGSCREFDNASVALDLQHLLLRSGVASRVQGNVLTVQLPAEPDIDAPLGTRWDSVVGIRVLPEACDTVAITVPEHGTYLTDLYEHNTFSSLILCLYWSMILEMGEILFVAPRMSQVEKFWDDLEFFIEAHPMLKKSLSSTGNTRKPFKKTFTNGTVLRGFTTGGGADGIRGQGADIIFLDETAYMEDADFKAITPIINGDKRRRFKPIVYAASTPAGSFGKFFKMCTQEKRKWHEIALSIEDNPEYTASDRAEVEETCSSREWETEYLCKFLDAGMNVFPLSLVEEAMIGGQYRIAQMPKAVPEVAGGKPVKRVWRTMGVDWDKFNEDGSGPTIAVVEVDERPGIGSGIPTVIYRQSIKQGPQCLTQAVNRVIELNEIMNPDYIFADAGNGEQQIEILHQHGMKNPYSGMAKKVKRVHFGGDVVIYDPATREKIKKHYKPFMVNLLSKWFEEHTLIFPKDDGVFKEQLVNYRITNQTINTTSYSKENEHIIDAVGMACVGMFQIHQSPFRLHVSNRAVLMPGPERMAADEMTAEETRKFRQTAPPIAKALVGKPAPFDRSAMRMAANGLFAVELEKEKPSAPETRVGAFAASIRRNLGTRFGRSHIREPHRRKTF